MKITRVTEQSAFRIVHTMSLAQRQNFRCAPGYAGIFFLL